MWRDSGGRLLKLDDWQKWLLRHMLEVYPKGHELAGELRYRQVIVSMGRQNGKSVLGAILGLYALLRERGALAFGIATSVEQATVIYDRIRDVIDSRESAENIELGNEFAKTTATRGLKTKSNSKYATKPSKSAALQGLPINFINIDEVHILLEALWSDAVNGTAAQRNGIVLGLTTAGDDESTLLLRLYDRIEKIDEEDPEESERFGFFIWEAPEAKLPEDKETLKEYLRIANPSVACGRLPMRNVLNDIKAMPEPDVIRYRLNRFVSSTNSFIPTHKWAACAGELVPVEKPIITIDRTPEWSHASIVATWKVNELTYTELVASIARPNIDSIAAVCSQIAAKRNVTFVADGFSLKGLVSELQRRGLTVQAATLADVTGASSMFFSKIANEELVHGNDALLTAQIPRTVRKNVGEAYRISRSDSGAEIDAVIATALGVYFAETHQDVSMQLF